MPTGIAPSDQKLLLIGGVMLLVFLVVSVALAPPPEQAESTIPSTYSFQSAGAQAAYRLLSRLHYPVRRWESPPTELDTDPRSTLLILAEPLQPPSPKEKQALLDFVMNGGHVLFTGPTVGLYLPQAHLTREVPDPSWRSFSAKLPTRITRGAEHITLQAQAFWSKPGAVQFELYGGSENPVVVSWARGKGNILWWAGSTPLSNAGITKADNLAFFLNSVGNWQTNAPYKIYWDEYFHGQRSSVWSYVGKTSLSWSLWQLAILALAVLFTFSRRSGPVYMPAEVSRLSPIEFVETLGGLYERADAAASAISISVMRLRTLLTRQLALPKNTANAELEQAAESRLGWRGSGLREALVRADAAIATKVGPQEALEIVRKLEGFTAKLDVRSQIRREKT
jgi:Domain of unknown function (DUF4350)